MTFQPALNLKSFLSQSLSNFVIIGSCFTELCLCRHNDFHISDRRPSWICDDVIIMHPVIDFHGFHIILFSRWLVCYCSYKPHIIGGDRETGRQTYVVIHVAYSTIPKSQFVVRGLNKLATALWPHSSGFSATVITANGLLQKIYFKNTTSTQRS